MVTDVQTIKVINNPVFSQLAQQVERTGRGVLVKDTENRQVVIVSKKEYKKIERDRALKELAVMTKEMQAAFSDISEKGIQTLVDETVEEVRAEKRKKSA